MRLYVGAMFDASPRAQSFAPFGLAVVAVTDRASPRAAVKYAVGVTVFAVTDKEVQLNRKDSVRRDQTTCGRYAALVPPMSSPGLSERSTRWRRWHRYRM